MLLEGWWGPGNSTRCKSEPFSLALGPQLENCFKVTRNKPLTFLQKDTGVPALLMLGPSLACRVLTLAQYHDLMETRKTQLQHMMYDSQFQFSFELLRKRCTLLQDDFLGTLALSYCYLSV